MIPEDYKYYYQTRDGYEIIERYLDKYGFLTITGKRPKGDYFVARGYDPTTGRWSAGGIYDIRTASTAKRYLLNGPDGPYKKFNPNNPKDIAFEYDAGYNYNHVDATFLKAKDHRGPEYPIKQMAHSDFDDFAKYGYYGKKYPYTQDAFEEHKRDYRKNNEPTRSRSVKSQDVKRSMFKIKSKNTSAMQNFEVRISTNHGSTLETFQAVNLDDLRRILLTNSIVNEDTDATVLKPLKQGQFMHERLGSLFLDTNEYGTGRKTMKPIWMDSDTSIYHFVSPATGKFYGRGF